MVHDGVGGRACLCLSGFLLPGMIVLRPGGRRLAQHPRSSPGPRGNLPTHAFNFALESD